MNLKSFINDWRVVTGMCAVAILIFIIYLKRKGMEAISNPTHTGGGKKLPKDHIPSDEGIKHFKRWEGYEVKAYRDSGGLWTIGIGHLIKQNEQYLMSKTLTNEEIMNLFKKDIKAAHNVVVNKIKVPITQGVYDACLSLAYNTGTLYSSIVSLVTNNDISGLAKRWLTTAITVKKGTVKVQGLINRRKAEVKLFA
jgi:lysozyme